MVIQLNDFTPVENRNGLWYKREDLLVGAHGVNGAKYRACHHLILQAALDGATRVVSAASVLSPQSAMAAVVARDLGLDCTIIVGGTTPEKAVKHKSIAIAAEAGADITAIPVGYNPALQKASLAASQEPGVWRLPYGITTPTEADIDEVEAFLNVGGAQVQNLPAEVETLVVPFGSGNTGAGILYGLHKYGPPANLKKLVLMGIGPDRQSWVGDRLKTFQKTLVPEGIELQHVSLHPTWATYGDRMPETLDGIVMHPTYEGKVVRFLETMGPDWWTRDDKTCLYIVGGPI